MGTWFSLQWKKGLTAFVVLVLLSACASGGKKPHCPKCGGGGGGDGPGPGPRPPIGQRMQPLEDEVDELDDLELALQEGAKNGDGVEIEDEFDPNDPFGNGGLGDPNAPLGPVDPSFVPPGSVPAPATPPGVFGGTGEQPGQPALPGPLLRPQDLPVAPVLPVTFERQLAGASAPVRRTH